MDAIATFSKGRDSKLLHEVCKYVHTKGLLWQQQLSPFQNYVSFFCLFLSSFLIPDAQTIITTVITCSWITALEPCTSHSWNLLGYGNWRGSTYSNFRNQLMQSLLTHACQLISNSPSLALVDNQLVWSTFRPSAPSMSNCIICSISNKWQCIQPYSVGRTPRNFCTAAATSSDETKNFQDCNLTCICMQIEKDGFKSRPPWKPTTQTLQTCSHLRRKCLH